MILLTIFLVFFTGLLILWSFGQHRFLNIFEQLALGFGVALSLFVFELFIQGIVLGRLSLLFPILTFIVFFAFLWIREYKSRGGIREIASSLQSNLSSLKTAFVTMKIWQKALCVAIFLYVLFKVFLSFSINISVPTFDEDAVTGWDMKTKVFVENKSLVLDKTNPEFLGSALERNIFAPLTDVYFLLPFDYFPVGLSNVISPLIYLCLALLLFGALLRKTNLLGASIGIYALVSLPFVFIHSFGSYFNYISGFFLFTFAFYLSDQLLRLEKGSEFNAGMIIPLGIFSFLDATIRNESLFLMLAIFVLEFLLFLVYRRGEFSFQKFKGIMLLFLGIIAAFTVNFYISSISPLPVGAVSLSSENTNPITELFTNIVKPGVFVAPFSQAFLHPDYNILYILFFIASIVFVFLNDKRSILGLILSTFVLLIIFMSILFINVEGFGLLSHFAFIRYPIAIMPFVLYCTVYIFFSFLKGQK